MANITKTFSFPQPDEYLAQTNELGLTAEWTYEGPSHLWVFVQNETGLLQVAQSFIPAKNAEDRAEEARVRAGMDQTAVLLSPGESDLDATLASIYISKDTGESTGYPQKEYAFPDGHPNEGEVYYKRPDPQGPDHTYDVSNIQYDLEAGTWATPFPWFQPWITLEQHALARDNSVAGAVGRLEEMRANLTPAQIAATEDFILEMEDLYNKFEGIAPHMIPFPEDPTAHLKEEYDYNADPEGLLVPAE
jgi:hypothetical protein